MNILPNSNLDNNVQNVEISTQEMKWLMEIGFMVSHSKYAEMALTIFHALTLCYPKADFPYIGMAIAYIGVNKCNEAIYILNNTLKHYPNSVEIKSILAMALKLEGQNNQAEKLLHEVLQSKRDSQFAEEEPVYQLAEQLLHAQSLLRSN